VNEVGWRESRIPLTYRLGEIRLFARSLRLMEYKAPFPALSGDPDALAASAGPLPPGFHGRLLRSHPIPAPLPRSCRVEGALRYVPQQYRRYVTDLGGSFDKYLAKFSSKTRANLRKKVRRFEEHCGGTSRWAVYRLPEEMDRFHALARSLSANTYQERLLDAGLPAGEEFLEGMRRAAAEDRVRAFLLFHGEKPVAYLYCPSSDGVLVYDYLGYDPEYRSLSPGTVLQYHAFDSLFAEGRWRLFDFTQGEGAHKELFATGSTLCADLYYLRPSAGIRVALAAHAALESFSGWVVRTLDRLGLKARIKRFFRAFAGRKRPPGPEAAPPPPVDGAG